MKINNYRNQLLIALEYFDTRQWTFHRYNMTEMMTKVKMLEDGNVVKLDLQDMDWKKYITNYQMGMKKFILKENFESVNAARRLSVYVSKYLNMKVGVIVIISLYIRLMTFLFISACTGYIILLKCLV